MNVDKKAYFASGIGNILEFYDFALYGFFARVFAKLFFPSEHPFTSLLLVYGVFAAGLISRPLGAILFGFLGDRINRKTTLCLSLTCIGLSTLAIGLLPTYETWGIMAPICLVILRLFQGISMGGEYSNSLVFVSEHLSKLKSQLPAFTTGMVSSMGLLGWFLASYLSIFLSDASGSLWRVPFILGSLVALVGLFIRSRTNDAFSLSEEKRPSFLIALREVFSYPKAILQTASVGLLIGVLFYGQFIFCSSFLPEVTHHSPTEISRVVTFGLLAYMCLMPSIGWLSDRIGHRKVVIAACIAAFCLSPLIFFLEIHGSLLGIFCSFFLVASILSALLSPGSYLMSHTFPSHIRCLGVSLSYNTGTAIFGGTIPTINLALYQFGETFLGPAFFLSLCALTAGLFLREMQPPHTAHVYQKR